MKEELKSLPFSSAFPTCFLGPSLDEGPLPSLFYFALSAEESLILSPFNQPVDFLRDRKMRLFSIGLPAHSPGIDPTAAIRKWKETVELGENPIERWVEDAHKTLSLLLHMGLLREDEIALAGLSRGAFCALHLAATLPFSLPVVCYAPLLDLAATEEFSPLCNDRIIRASHIGNLVESLSPHRFFFSIGNRDTRVGTTRTFCLVEQLAEQMFQNGKRSPPIELHVTPSIGFKGHGTSKELFELGAAWAAHEIGAAIDETV